MLSRGATMQDGRLFSQIALARAEGRVGRRVRLPKHLERERRLLALRYLRKKRERLEGASGNAR